MIKIILKTLSGILLILIGIYLFYLYMISLETGSNLLFLLVALTCIASGGYLLYKASRTEVSLDSSEKTDLKADDSQPTATGLAETLRRNNEIATQWDKTQKERDKLKMLEIASSAGKPKD